VREAATAVGMLEESLAALWDLDVERARAVRLADDVVDAEEVAIEQQCHELLALHKPFARDFRSLTFILKANSDLERVADHASSISKVTIRLAQHVKPNEALRWPTALVELGERVPAMCHELLRAVLDENVDRARELVLSDKVIDQLERRMFEENIEQMLATPRNADDLAVGIMLARIGRELERVGDLMSSIAEDVVYVATGQIVRHTKRRGATRGARPPESA
jgi:phosphate transport system protein